MHLVASFGKSHCRKKRFLEKTRPNRAGDVCCETTGRRRRRRTMSVLLAEGPILCREIPGILRTSTLNRLDILRQRRWFCSPLVVLSLHHSSTTQHATASLAALIQPQLWRFRLSTRHDHVIQNMPNQLSMS